MKDKQSTNNTKQYLLFIFLILLSACSSTDLSLLSGSSKKIIHTETRKVYFTIDDKELVWSRMHYYVFICLGYPVARQYNPYILHASTFEPFSYMTIAREIEKNRIRLIISYSREIKSVKVKDAADKSSYKNDSDDIKQMIDIISDMIEYAGTGIHKKIPDKEVKLKNPKEEMEERTRWKKDHFFFY